MQNVIMSVVSVGKWWLCEKGIWLV